MVIRTFGDAFNRYRKDFEKGGTLTSTENSRSGFNEGKKFHLLETKEKSHNGPSLI